MFELIASTDITTSAAFHAREERRGREETLAMDIPRPVRVDTSSLVYLSELPSVSHGEGGTPTTAELAQLLRTEKTLRVVSFEIDDVERARRARVSLLARKYEGASSVEDDARIDILTERLRRLSPRVTNTDLGTMSKMVEDLEKVSLNINRIRENFGLK